MLRRTFQVECSLCANCQCLSKGSQNAKVMENGHNNCAFYGRGRSYSRSDCERLWRQLVVDGVLAEKLFVTAQDHTVCYMELGRKAQDVLQGRLKVVSNNLEI